MIWLHPQRENRRGPKKCVFQYGGGCEVFTGGLGLGKPSLRLKADALVDRKKKSQAHEPLPHKTTSRAVSALITGLHVTLPWRDSWPWFVNWIETGQFEAPPGLFRMSIRTFLIH